MTEQMHTPTSAGPTPDPPAGAVGSGPGAAAGEGGTELPFGIPPDRPELLVGAAFAGGMVAAFILKRLGGD
jgi:hypothetical protein